MFEGNLWCVFLTGPYNTIYDHTIPYKAIQDNKRLYKTVQVHTIKFKTIQDYIKLNKTIQDHTRSYRILKYHARP